MKKIILIIPLLLCACAPKYNVEYREYKPIRAEWLKKATLEDYKAEDSEYSLLFFTNGFKGEEVLVINKPDTLYNARMESGLSLGLAEILRINNTKPLKIVIEDIVIKLKEENVLNHKFIYLSRNFNEKYLYTITYSGTPRQFR